MNTPDDDLSAVHEGYVALTPLTVDWTARGFMDELKGGMEGLGK